jgi:hypothetical protein
LPIALIKTGTPLLPEHSIVLTTFCLGRAFNRSNVIVVGLLTMPATSSLQSLSSIVGTS